MDEPHKDWREGALAWVGRKVRITDGPSTEHGDNELGTVICVDATDYRPSAWVKVGGDLREGRSSYPSYRSCDLCWLEDAETDDSGPVWCSSPGTEGHGELDAAVIATRIRAIATEAGTAATTEIGAVHEGAGPKDIAQGPSQ